MTDYKCPHLRQGECNACRKARLAVEAEVRETSHVDWYRQTGHCGACGQPGVFCLCRTPCGCHELHEVGSGLVADPAEVFADVSVSDDQGELFGAAGGTE